MTDRRAIHGSTYTSLRRLRLLLLAAAMVLVGLVVPPPPPASAAPCDVPVANPVACENSKPGNPESEWGISGSGSSSIQGFATDISVDQGGTVGFKVDTAASSYRLDIYRMGYYAGAGARRIATVTPTVLNNQPACLTDSTTGLVDCGNWTQNASWTVPADAVSGVYFAKLVRTDNTSGSSHVYFVVRDDDGGSDLLFQTSDTTWQAYNRYGGNSLYTGSPAGRAYKVSYNRPFTTRDYAPEDFVFNSEYPMVRFLERNGYDVSYTTGVDTDRRGAELLEHQAFLSVGHDEYWSGDQRTNVEAARAAGVHLAFFSGNEVFWKTRWEKSIDASGTPHRTLVSYKETHADAVIDPAAPTWTGTWRDPRFSPPGDGGRPENALTGTIFEVNCCAIDMRVAAADGKMRFWRNTRVANLAPGASTTIGTDVIGYEWDKDADNGHRPPGLVRLSETTGSGDVLQDYGSSYGSGSATHAMTLYKHDSGALVFGAGTIQWPWALDGNHDRGSAAPDTAAQQATVNLFADMGVQPDALQSGLTAATTSTDTTAPASTITSPAGGATVPVGEQVTVTGTATDAGGGNVGGVEVSTDGGQTWRRATGRESWTYTFTPGAAGTLQVRSRATDDSANIETPGVGVTLTAGSGTGGDSCPCSIWPASATPDRTDPDRSAVEVGVKFRASAAGYVTGIRFYKPAESTGTHVGSLWTRTGTRLANVTFTNETTSGWQQALFSQPVPVTANTTYVASYHTPSRYATTSGYFTTPTTRGPLTALQDGTDGGNGVYRYTATPGAFPDQTFKGENYWVDVVFENTPANDTTKPTLTARTPAPGATGVAVNATPSATFSEPVQQSTVSFTVSGPDGAVQATTAYDAATRTATRTPSSALQPGTAYTAAVSGAKDTAGNLMDPVTWTFTTAAADTTKPAVTARVPAPDATNVATGSTVSATFDEPVQAGTISFTLRDAGGGPVTATTAYDAATRTVRLTPGTALAGGTTYTASLSGATDPSGNTMEPVTWSFTTATSAFSCPCSIWPGTATPQRTDPDRDAVELGVKFRASTDGYVTGIRYYKPAESTGTHVGSLWTRTGTRLANVTFTNETTSGWQQALFSQPVPVTANTTYVASYHTPSRYASDSNYLTTATTRGPLTALADGTDGGNGLYRYSSTPGAFPDQSFRSENYWVDVVFEDTDTTKPTVTTRVPAPGATNVATGTAVSATFGEPVQAASILVELRNAAGVTVPATTAYDAATRTATLTPSSALQPGTAYTAAVSGAKDTAGNLMDPVTWTFTTAALDVTKPTVTARTPATGAVDVSTATTVTATFDEAVDGGSVVLELRNPAGTVVAATTTYDAPTRTARLTPNAALQPSTAYTAAVSGAKDTAGNVMDPVTWSFTTAAADTTKPSVTSRVPAPSAINVATNATVSATFDEAVDGATVTFTLTGPAGTALAATTAYDGTTRTARLTPNAALQPGTTYTADLSGARDTSGNVMDPVSWTFTTATSVYGCPCSIWPSTATPPAADADPSPVELGVKFRVAQDGFITAVRYYKPAESTGTHVGTLWTASGTKLATVTFPGGTASGWQEAALDGPVPVTAGATYVASYHTPSRYVASGGYFAGSPTTRGPLTALQDGTAGGNGVYAYSATPGTFPTNTYNSANYWVDVVFSENATDTTAPTVTTFTPGDGATGVPATTIPTARFSESLDASALSMQLKSGSGATVAGTVAYDDTTRTVSLTPASPLAYSTSYTVSVSGARDLSGNTMAPVSWSFTTSAAPPPPPDQGPGGAIAVVTSDAASSSTYLVEIMRAEGLNHFSTIKNTAISGTTLAEYDVVVLGNVAVTDAQVTALTAWVNGGGNLVMMRPDSRLLGLAGLTPRAGTVSEGYLAVNPATEPGAGITTATMQFHGTADRYALDGATAVADLYASASTPAGNPAVTWRDVGTSGGQVAVFAYDLARSVIQTRQGNPAWAGQNRDGQTPNRSNDQFYGGSTTDWVDLDRVPVPQADEQQRLLANLITVMNRDKMPVPRFWYFPDEHKAVVVATGDDHGNNGTAGRFATYVAASPAGCSPAAWDCFRFSSYMYSWTGLSTTDAVDYNARGFEVGVHTENGCSNYGSLAELSTTYTEQLGQFADRYPTLPDPTTSRYHCIVWSDWASQPKAELAHGIRLDTNYYYYPGSWVADRPGFMNGSGIPMRFTDTDGSLIDVFQAHTAMTDESGQSYPFTPNTLLDRALGPDGYYGAFTANLHTDNATTFEDTQVLASAQERDVPVVTARQLLTWLDGRQGSSFSNLQWDAGTMTFDLAVGAGANRLTGMLPTTGPEGRTLASLSRAGSPVAFTTSTVKGQEYAFFPAAGGSYTATYTAPAALRIASADIASVEQDAATFTWSTDEPATTTVSLGTSAEGLATTRTVADRTTTHRVAVKGLAPGRTYYYRVSSSDATGTERVWPAAGQAPATFRTPPADSKPPVLTDFEAFSLPDGTMQVRWRTDEPSTSRVLFGTAPNALSESRVASDLTTDHLVVLTGLEARTSYWVRVGSTDAVGNRGDAGRVTNVTTVGAGVAVQTVEEFRVGQTDGRLTVDDRGLGALTLAGPGTGTYESPVIDPGVRVDWTGLVLRASVPAGARVEVSVRTGLAESPDETWTDWTDVGTSDTLDLPGRFLQYRVRLTAASAALPSVTAIGFTHDGELPEPHREVPAPARP